MDTMMAQQPNGAAFYFYSPDPNPEGRQHGRFIAQHHQHQHQHPHQQHPALQQMPMLPIVAPLPSTPVYSRPGSSCSQPPLLPKGFTNGIPILPSTLTPMASPVPIALKPTIVLDTELSEAEGLYSPSTPPLSSSGSVISSPGSCDMLQTPLNPMFSGLDGKETCDLDGELESFPNLDWSACASPPLTPGKPFFFFLPLFFQHAISAMYCAELCISACASHGIEPTGPDSVQVQSLKSLVEWRGKWGSLRSVARLGRH
jgi:hypothetical protein